MIVDTSALVAILRVEPDAAVLLLCLSQASSAMISTPTLPEAQMVVCSHVGEEEGLPELELLLSRTHVQPMAFEGSQLHWALQGWRRSTARAAIRPVSTWVIASATGWPWPRICPAVQGPRPAHTDVRPALSL